jgi:hypothetical protein
LALVCGVVASVIVAVLIHHLLGSVSSSDATAWSLAISATTAIAIAVGTAMLAAVTYVYVTLTRRLVEHQADRLTPIRLAQREDAATEASVVLADNAGTLHGIAGALPLREDALDPLRLTGWDEFERVAASLNSLMPRLPAQLTNDAELTRQACTLAALAQRGLYDAVRQAAMGTVDAQGNMQPWGMAECQAKFELLVERGAAQDLEWDKVRAGTYLVRACAAVDHLRQAVNSYLGSDRVT